MPLGELKRFAASAKVATAAKLQTSHILSGRIAANSGKESTCIGRIRDEYYGFRKWLHYIDDMTLERVSSKSNARLGVQANSLPLESHDDFFILNNDLTCSTSIYSGITLFSRVRNELYFLRSFLPHYRKLGVDRFIIIDDDSTDGTKDFLFKQADCMVLGSKYSHRKDYPIAHTPCGHEISGVNSIWLCLLLRKYSIDQWAVYADADEFLRLPENIKIQDIVSALDCSKSNAAYTVMYDVYPASFSDFNQLRNDKELKRDNAWYFDGIKHFHLNDGNLRFVYGGSRSRLMQKFRVGSFNRPIKSMVRELRRKVPQYNMLRKSMIVKIPENGYMIGPHKASFKINTEFVLPFEHYKLSGSLHDRLQNSLDGYRLGGKAPSYDETLDLIELLSKMEDRCGEFICKYSVLSDDFRNFVNSGNVLAQL